MAKVSGKKSNDDKKLIQKAREARGKAYAPYSKFKVGAAVLTKKGKIYTGANVESVSYGLTACAERVALYNAVISGEKKFKKIVVVTDTEEPSTPCGLCRQVLSEFGEELEVICVNLKGKVRKFKLKQLLPYSFRRNKLKM
ncbi:MAG: cytidine deaminase [Candidatus Zixiibacteriota bacterium]